MQQRHFKISGSTIRVSILILMLLFKFSNKSFGQTVGESCNNPIVINSNSCLDSFATADSLVWFSFTASDASMEISLFNFYSGVDSTFTDVRLLGSCSSNTPISVATFSPPAIWAMHANGLIVGNVYYLRLRKNSLAPALINICNIIAPQSVPCPCPFNGTNNTHNCDVICNGGFEIFQQAITVTGWGQLNRACPWYDLIPAPFIPSTDLLNFNSTNFSLSVPVNYFGNQNSYNLGNGYAGIITYANDPGNVPVANYREYIVEQFSFPLAIGVPYDVKFYVSLGEACGFASSDIGASLYITPPVQPISPSGLGTFMAPAPAGSFVHTGTGNYITNDVLWTPIQGTVVGAAQDYIAIGQFTDDATNAPNPHAAIGPGGANAPRYSYYYVDSVYVVPLPLAAIPNDTICSGASITLTAPINPGSNTTFGWTDLAGNIICNNCTSIVVNPTTTSSYIFFVNIHSGTCTLTTTATIVVNPNPTVNITVPDGAVTCDYSLTFTVAGGYSSYTWNSNATPGSIHINHNTDYTADWPNGAATDGYVTILVTNQYGCSAFDSVSIPHCCCDGTLPTPLNIIAVNDNVDSLIAHYPLLVGVSGPNTIINFQNLCISGIFTVNRNLDLKGVKVSMGTNAKINILPGVTLKLEGVGNTLLQQTVIQACDRMWDGIYIDGTNSSSLLDITDGTVIEDAHHAIVSSNGGNYQIHGTVTRGPVKLNKNDTAIYVKPVTGIHPGRIVNTIIACDPPNTAGGSVGVTSLGANCIAPVNARSNAGIVVDHATVNIGDNTNIQFRNIFERLNFGITAHSSNVIVKNNIIRTMAAVPPNTFTGVGIYAYADKLNNGTLIVGGPLALDSNYFFNCNIGIDARNYVNLNSENNTFRITNGPNIGSFAIGIFNGRSTNALVLNNRIWGWQTGLWMQENSLMTADVRSNYINITPYSSSPVVNATSKYGMRIENAVQMNMNINVRENKLTRCQIGIEMINVLPSFPSNIQPRINYNKIGFDFTPPSFLASQYYGIRVINSKDVLVQVDTIVRLYNSVLGGPLPPVAIQPNLRGVHIENSSAVTVEYNFLSKLGTGVWMEASCPASKLTCNTFFRCYDAFFMNAATIGSQYAGLPNDNLYALTPNGAHSTFDIDGVALPPINWDHRNNQNWYVPNNNALATVFTVVNNITTSACGPIPPPLAPPARTANWSGIVQNQITYPQFDSETKYRNKQLAYRNFRNNPNQIILGTTDDTTYQNFCVVSANCNLGKFADIIDTLRHVNVIAALSINNSISGINVLEEKRKIVNNIYLHSWAIDHREFSAADSTTLFAIAYSNPIELGDAVYSARVMLGLDTEFFYVNSNRNIALAYENENAKVYPNPSSGEITIEYEISEGQNACIEIYSMLGQKLASYKLEEGSQHHINLKGLNVGTYICRIVVDGETTSIGSIIIE